MGLLKDLAKQKFATAIAKTQAADIPNLIEAIKIIYTSTLGSDRGLRDCILPSLSAFKQQLRDSDDFMALILSGFCDGEFAVEVIDAWSGLRQTRRV